MNMLKIFLPVTTTQMRKFIIRISAGARLPSLHSTPTRHTSHKKTLLQLPSATYNWVMFEDYEFSLGKVINQLEFGVKHAEIAFNRSVIAAGRLKVEQV